MSIETINKVLQPLPGYSGNPQAENGHTRIANELLEAILIADFSKRQQKIILAIIRKTYGYNKTSDDMTVSQLALLTGIAAPHVSTTIKELIASSVVIAGSGRYGKTLSINKLYDQWGVTKTVTVTKTVMTETVTPSYQNGNYELPKQSFGVTKTVHTKDNPKRQLQKTISKDKPTSVPQEIWDDWTALRKAKKAPITPTAVKGIEREAAIAGLTLADALQTCCANGWQGFKAAWVVKNNSQPKNMGKADRFNSAMDRVFGKEKEIEHERDITAIAERMD